jgi:toxoflavin biosynthesis protein ToxD
MTDEALVVRGEINSISDRAAMGLPEGYVSPFGEDLAMLVESVRTAPLPQLASRAESTAEPVELRLAVGLVLGLVGDPRCPDLEPAMVDIPAGTATLGLNPARVEPLYQRYRRYGVKQNWLEKECPRFRKELAAFRIGRYPVTNSQYLAFLKDRSTDGGAEHLPTSWSFGRFPPGVGNQPAFTVTAEAADAWPARPADPSGCRPRPSGSTRRPAPRDGTSRGVTSSGTTAPTPWSCPC